VVVAKHPEYQATNLG